MDVSIILRIVCNSDMHQSVSRSTQLGHPFVGRCSECQPKDGDARRLGSKGR